MKGIQILTKLILALLLVLLFVSSIKGADLQRLPDVQKQFRFQLPGHWGLETFKIEESKNFGSEEEPIFKQLFTAGIVLLEDTYVLDQKDGAVSLLAPAAKAGEKRIVRGIATSVAKGTTWRTQWGLESDPTSGLGKTLSFFSGKVIIRGTPEEVEYQQKAKETRQKFFEKQARGRLALDLPGYWQLKTFSLDKSVSPYIQGEGDLQKFTAVIELLSDTFKAVEKLGEVTILAPFAKTGEQRRIYGKIKASHKSIELEYDNNVTKNLGEPKDFYQDQVLIEGTAEVDKLRHQLHEQKVTKLQRQKDLEEQNDKLKAARIVFAAKLEEQKEMQLAKEKDAAVRKEAGKRRKQEQEMELLKNELFGSDRTIWFRAFEKSLKSDDPQKQNLAIASYLNINKAINGILLAGGTYQGGNIGIIGLTIRQFDFDTNQFAGIVEGISNNSYDLLLRLRTEELLFGEFNGSLQGTEIHVEGTYKIRSNKSEDFSKAFSFSAKLEKYPIMEGPVKGIHPLYKIRILLL